MEEEIRSLVGMGTWELVERPPGVNIMKNRWVLTTKYHINDTVEREKARVVVKGFTQVYGTDYDEMYAPVSSYVTLRIFLSIVAVLDLSLMQLDMKNAFLQSKLDRVLYMHQPDYFNDGSGRVCKLLKSLYGLKQSPLLWYRALDVYVDDLLAASSSTEMLKELKELLEGAFEPCEISSVHKYLGLEIIRDRSVRKLWLHQQGYADKLRRRFLDEEQTGRTPKTPVSVDAYAELTFDDKETQERQEDEYRQKVGSLQFAATTTRPDIAFAYSKLWSGLTVRSDQHWRKVDRCLAYLANTRGTTLEFGGGPESLKLVSYVDADNAGDKQNRTSTGGYVFVYREAAVSWSSHRIKCATLSSTESEYVAATEAGKEGRRLRFLLAEFRQLDAGKPIVLRVDNKWAIIVAEGMGALTSGGCQLRLVDLGGRLVEGVNLGDADQGKPTGCGRLTGVLVDLGLVDQAPGLSAPAATATTTAAAATTATATAAPAYCATMASLRVRAFHHEGRPVQFDTWLDDLQLYLRSDSKDSWLTRDAAARLAIRNHLPLAECAHFGQHRTAQALYDAVVARYSSPATAALGRLLLPYLFPELSAFATVEDLVSHLRASDARYRAAAPAEFLEKNQPSMFITLYFIVTRLHESLCSVRDHFLSLDPTSLIVDLLESLLRLVHVSVAEDAGAASASAKHRSSKGKGGRGGGGGSGGGGGASGSSGGGSSGGGGSGGTGGGSGGSGGGGGGSGGRGGSGTGARRVGSRGGQRIDAATLGASESGTLPGTAPAQALHTFTLDSGASRCFLRDSTNLTPLPAPVPVRIAGPFGGPVVARSSTVLPCPAVPSGSLSSLHLPSFSTNLVSTAALHDAMVTTTTPGGHRMSICTCTWTDRHLATLTRWPGSSLYTVATEPPQVAASAQVSASRQVEPPCSCRLLSHQTLLWHHCLGHPSLPRLRGMNSRLLVSGLPRSMPPLPPSPAPPCLPCVKGRQCAAPHSSSFPPTTAPLQTLHMDMWGPARVSGQGRERYIPLVVDDYTRYTTVFPLQSKGQVVDVLIPWIRTVCLQLRERFGQDLPVLRLDSDRGDSPQQNGIAERRIGLVMEVACTSMIHAAAPHFLWSFAVRYAAHQLNLWPRVCLPETSPTLRWTGEVGDALVFRVLGSRALVRDTSADKLSARAIPCVFLGFVPDTHGWQFYHPTSCGVFPSQDVTFDESVPFYRLFPYRSAPPRPPPLFLAPGPPPVDPLPPQGLAPSVLSLWVWSLRVLSRRVRSLRGSEPRGAALSGGPTGASPRLSLKQPRKWFVRSPRLRSGATGAGGAGDAGARGAGVNAGAGGAGGTAATGPGGARTRGTGAAGTGGVEGAGAGDPTEPGGAGAGGSGTGGSGAGGAGAAGAGAVDPGAGGAGDSVRPRLYFVPLIQQPASQLPAPSPYTEQSGGPIERREPTSRTVSPVRTARRIPRSRPPFVPGTHAMALRPSSSDHARAASPTVARLLATAVTDPSFESAVASALVAELLDFVAASPLDYATALVAESDSANPPSVGGECALGTNVLEDRQEEFECLAAAVPRFASMLLALEGDLDAQDTLTPRSYAEAITGTYSSQWQAAMDAEMASWKSTSTYVDEVPPPRANIVDAMWIFRVKQPPGSPPAFKALSLADPSGDPVLAHSSTVLPCPAAPSGLLSGLHLPSFSTNLVSGPDLQDAWVDQFTPGGQRVTHCTCSRTGRHLATFTRRPGSSLYTLTTAPPPVAASGQVATSGQVFSAASRSSPVSAPCSCRPLSHETLVRHHRLGHPSLPRLRGMASRTLAPLQTLHMDVWGPARVRGKGHERYFLLVVDDYSRYTTVFPLRSKGEVPEVLIDWIRGTRCQLSESFGSDLPVLRLHSDRGGEFSSDLLRAFCRAEGIRQTFMLLASPQQNGIAERRIGMVMDVARMSMIHAAAPHFVWPFVVQYAAHQINLQPRVSLPETTPTLRVTSADPAGAGTGGVGPGVAVSEGAERGGAECGSVEHGGAEPERAESGGPPGVPSRREPLSAQQLREWYTLRCRCAAGAGAAGGASGAAGGASRPGAAGGVAGAGATGGANGAGAAGGAAGAGAAGGAAGAGAARGTAGARAAGATGPGGSGAGGTGAVGAAGGAGAAGPRGARTGGTGVAGAGGASGVGAAGARAVATGGAAGAGAIGVTGAGGAAGVVVGDPGAEGTGAVSAVSGGAARPQPYYVPLLQQVLGPPPLLSPPPVRSQSQLQPASPPPGPSPYSGPTRGLTERREPESRPASPESRSESHVRAVRTGRCVPRQCPPPVPCIHSMTLRPSTTPQRVPLPSPPASSLLDGPDPESDSLRAASPTVTCFLATAITNPLFDSSAASALVAELVDFAAACRLDYATSLVAESVSASVCSLSVGGECALGRDVLEDRQEEFECFATAVPHLVSMLLAPEGDPDAPDIPTPRSYAEAIEGPYSSQWQAAMDAKMASWKSTGTYVDEVPPPRANIVSGMWIFKVKRPPGSPPVFKRPSRQVEVTVSEEEISQVTEDGGEPEVEEQQQQQQRAPPRALCPPEHPRRDSVKKEYDSLLENETWELCELPPGKKAISSKLIFGHKYGPDGELTHYKSRLVANGFLKTKGKDFDEIFAPVGKGTTLRVMLGMAANRGWRIKQMDITTAFLNGIIQEELYMLQPEGLDDGSGRVCRLKKAIYGLKQAPRAWYHKLEETLLAGGFKKSECDHSLFLLQEKEQFLMLLVYVDDILLFSKSSAMIEHVEEMLEMQFKCSKMGDVKYYLDMHVERDLDKGVLRLHQRKYCEGLAEKYGLQDGGKPATPLPLGFTVEPCADEEVVGLQVWSHAPVMSS
ncbi:unnamed protein product [Closterium sp. NIES-54]